MTDLIRFKVAAMKYRPFYARHEFEAATLDEALALAKAHNWDNQVFEPTGDWVPVQSLLAESDDEERTVDLEPYGGDAIAVLGEFIDIVKLAHGTGGGDTIDVAGLDWPNLAHIYQKAVAVLACEPPPARQPNVFVAIYEHDDTDIRVFRTLAQAQAWRRKIGDTCWEQEFDDVPRPAGIDIGDAYFNRMRERGEEFFRIEANPIE
jgi:hypothetical protein